MKSKLKELEALYQQCIDNEDDKHAEMYAYEIISVLDEMHIDAYLADNKELVSKIEAKMDKYMALVQ